jgi:hypothetical protein
MIYYKNYFNKGINVIYKYILVNVKYEFVLARVSIHNIFIYDVYI